MRSKDGPCDTPKLSDWEVRRSQPRRLRRSSQGVGGEPEMGSVPEAKGSGVTNSAKSRRGASVAWSGGELWPMKVGVSGEKSHFHGVVDAGKTGRRGCRDHSHGQLSQRSSL